MKDAAASVDEHELAELREHYAGYRQYLQDACVKAQESFDKTVLTLSGGALGVSFVFLKDVIGARPIAMPSLLVSAWAAWAASSLAVLFSFHLSHLALRKAIARVDDGTIGNGEKPGGRFATATSILNAAGAVLFFVGVVLIVTFASFNLTERSEANGNATPATDTPTATTSSTQAPASRPGPGTWRNP